MRELDDGQEVRHITQPKGMATAQIAVGTIPKRLGEGEGMKRPLDRLVEPDRGGDAALLEPVNRFVRGR